jgi:translation initiation factor IF-2
MHVGGIINPLDLALTKKAKLDKGRGAVATVLVQDGTLHVGDAFVAGTHFGHVRAMINDRGEKIENAGPSTPVEVIGFDSVPNAGESFVVITDERRAKELATQRLQKQREMELAKTSKVTLEDFYKKMQKGVVKDLNLILKADVQGLTPEEATRRIKIRHSASTSTPVM